MKKFSNTPPSIKLAKISRTFLSFRAIPSKNFTSFLSSILCLALSIVSKNILVNKLSTGCQAICASSSCLAAKIREAKLSPAIVAAVSIPCLEYCLPFFIASIILEAFLIFTAASFQVLGSLASKVAIPLSIKCPNFPLPALYSLNINLAAIE